MIAISAAGSRCGDPQTHPKYTGAAVIGVWFVELLLMALAPLSLVALGTAAPFCETCEAWAVRRDLARLRSVDPRAMLAAVKAWDFDELLDPVQLLDSGSSASRTLHACPKCPDSGWLDMALDEDRTLVGEAVRRSKPLADLAVLTGAERRRLEERRRNAPPRPPAGN